MKYKIAMNTPTIGQGCLKTALYLIALLFTMFISVALFSFLSIFFVEEISLEDLLIKRENIFFLILFQAIILVNVTLATIMFRFHIDNKDFISLGFQKLHVRKDISRGIITGFGCIATGFLILYFAGYIYIEKINSDFTYLIASLVFYLMVSWIEEISFRGYILNNLMESFNKYSALGISSFLFALFHILNSGISVLAFTNLFLAGLLLGIVFIYTRTIWFALSLHFSWNFFQGPVFGFNVSGIEMPGLIKTRIIKDDIVSGGEFGFEGSVICTLLAIIAIFILSGLYNKQHKI